MQTLTQPVIDQTYVLTLMQKAFDNFKKSGNTLYSPMAEASVMKMVQITFNERYRTRGGTCKTRPWPMMSSIHSMEIILSVAFMKNTTEDKHFQLVSHELAHGYHAYINGSSDHGWKWRMIHQAMGGDGERCHDVEVKRNKVKRIVIGDRRNGKTYTISLRKWNQIKSLKLHDGNDRFTFQRSFVQGEQQMATA